MEKIYIETTVFNRYVEDEREYSAETKLLFEKIKAGEFEGYASMYVYEELLEAEEPKRQKMLNLIDDHGIIILKRDVKAEALAELYIKNEIFKGKSRFDAAHVAIASTKQIDYIVSLNFRHINRLKTKERTGIINKMYGYGVPLICTPMEVI